MISWLISFAIAVATSTVLLVFGTGIIEAMRRRGFDLVGTVANIFGPMPPSTIEGV